MADLLDVASAAQEVDQLLRADEAQQKQGRDAGISEEDCTRLISASLDRDNAALARSIYEAMCRGTPSVTTSIDQYGSSWPPATLVSVSALVLGLARSLRLSEALSVIQDIRRRGVPRGEEVPFGHVVRCPLGPQQPLAVVQPQEGVKVVACAQTRYQFELFSGSVVSTSSEALNATSNWAIALARKVGLWRAAPLAAIHQLVVQAPDGRARTFRFATESAEVPAQQGERVTVICSPSKGSAPGRLFAAGPPGTQPGQPLTITNHGTGAELALLRPPASSAGLPSWILPAAVFLAGSDAATAFIDPALPALAAGGALFLVGSSTAAVKVLVPRLKQLSEAAVQGEEVRQRLLAQHAVLVGRMEELMEGCSADVRTLARLWQLQNKMEAVGQGGVYDARLVRVQQARDGLEQRLQSKLSLLDGYARVLNMIEIEVEMDTEVAAAEVVDIEQQIERLGEVAEMQAEWQMQAEAQDEVERLLRTV
ncbi:hypothetical protein WJX72_008368 [[Myrmecia] bisecta]|uniref:Uncharacterized protein n=1 Tax=[Myrmecia] bisecta TaxID=41462 RepID=A0AAW1PQE4_9CHLO